MIEIFKMWLNKKNLNRIHQKYFIRKIERERERERVEFFKEKETVNEKCTFCDLYIN